MALPPILSSLPILKLFGSDRAPRGTEKTTPDAPRASSPQDTVELSATVQGIPRNDAEAQQVAVETGAQLAQKDTFTMGLDPGFVSGE
jgi:hypothetical protein